MKIRIILTGATGLVGEGVLKECLEHPDVTDVLLVNRRKSDVQHPKVKEAIVDDFFKLDEITEQLKGYDACFYCAGISSAGMKERDYSKITLDIPLHFANHLLKINPQMTFSHVSGAHTDSSEKGKVMWARIKGKAENALMRLPFRNVYNFRPGLMKPTKGQKNVRGFYRVIAGMYPVFSVIFPNSACLMKDVGQAMINSVLKGYPQPILEVPDIKALAQ